MGCNQSLDKKESVAGNKRIFETRQKGSCVVEIVRANNLPDMDIVSLTDAFVTFSFRECMHGAHKTKPLGDISYRTLTCNNSLNPIIKDISDVSNIAREALDKINNNEQTFEKLNATNISVKENIDISDYKDFDLMPLI